MPDVRHPKVILELMLFVIFKVWNAGGWVGCGVCSIWSVYVIWSFKISFLYTTEEQTPTQPTLQNTEECDFKLPNYIKQPYVM